MKKWFAFLAIFLSSYIVFIVASAPLTWLINMAEVDSSIKIESPSGTIWQGEIQSITVKNNRINQVKTSVSFWSLFTLSPSVDIMFGDAMLPGPEGELTLRASSERLTITDLSILTSASDIVNNLSLPIPVYARGDIELSFATLDVSLGKNMTCLEGAGGAQWQRASATAMEQSVKLGQLSATLSCEDGDVHAKLNPNNDLGISYDVVYTMPELKLSGQGYLKPGTKFPKDLKPALSFLGRADNQGRYRLKF